MSLLTILEAHFGSFVLLWFRFWLVGWLVLFAYCFFHECEWVVIDSSTFTPFSLLTKNTLVWKTQWKNLIDVSVQYMPLSLTEVSSLCCNKEWWNMSFPLSLSFSDICNSPGRVWQIWIRGHDQRVSRSHSVLETGGEWRSNAMVSGEKCSYNHTHRRELKIRVKISLEIPAKAHDEIPSNKDHGNQSNVE